MDSVCLTGGEPLLWTQTSELILRIRRMGYRVKLDTNGSFPTRLETLVREGMVDYVAMDVKNSPVHYARTVGCLHPPLETVRKSVELLLSEKVDYEFRTTVVRELHDVQDMRAIGHWLKGAKRYFLQNFVCSPQVPDQNLTPFSKQELAVLRDTVLEFVPNTQIRGE